MSVVQRETFSDEGLVNRLLIGNGPLLDLDTPLPYIPFDLLVVILRSLSHDGLHTALKQGVVPAAWMPYRIFFAQCDGFLPVAGLQLVGKIKRSDFNLAIDAVFSQRIARVAVFGLAKSAPHFSARRRITFPQAVCLLALMDFVGTMAVFLPSGVTHHIIGLSFLVFFGSMVWLRILALGEPDVTKPHEPELDNSKLPVYSVLVPMFREACVLPQLVAALRALHYPTSKLDIKLILEQSDTEMRRAVTAMNLPEHFHVLVVPKGRPQTKPRALNYALHFARGSLVTIYDAEDIPEPMQLRAAAKRFAELPNSCACLQAELSYYNPNENWLTRGIMAQTPQENQYLTH